MNTVSDARRERFEAVIQLVGEPLRQYAARRIDAESAEDVLADSFLVIWRRLDELPYGGELPWCYAVARNCLANVERSARRQRGLLTRIARMDPPRAIEEKGAAHDRRPRTPSACRRPRAVTADLSTG